MAIKYRQELGRPLTYAEGDENFRTLAESIEKTLSGYPTLAAALAADIPDNVIFQVDPGDPDEGIWRRDSSVPEGAVFLRKPVTQKDLQDISEFTLRNIFNPDHIIYAFIRSSDGAINPANNSRSVFIPVNQGDVVRLKKKKKTSIFRYVFSKVNYTGVLISPTNTLGGDWQNPDHDSLRLTTTPAPELANFVCIQFAGDSDFEVTDIIEAVYVKKKEDPYTYTDERVSELAELSLINIFTPNLIKNFVFNASGGVSESAAGRMLVIPVNEDDRILIKRDLITNRFRLAFSTYTNVLEGETFGGNRDSGYDDTADELSFIVPEGAVNALVYLTNSGEDVGNLKVFKTRTQEENSTKTIEILDKFYAQDIFDESMLISGGFSGNKLSYNAMNKFISIPVNEGDRVIIRRETAFSDRFRYAFTRNYPVENGMEIFGGDNFDGTFDDSGLEMDITVPAGAASIAVYIKNSVGDDWDQISIFKKPSNIINSRSKKYLFGDFYDVYTSPDMDDVSIGNNFELWNTTSSQIYQRYDEVMTRHPNTISKNLIGYGSTEQNTDDTNAPIYEYIIEPLTMPAVGTRDVTEEMYIDEPPTVLVICGLHGNEKATSYGFLKILELMLDEGGEPFDSLRSVRFKVIPVANPWGWDNNERLNINSVDLNRSFNTTPPPMEIAAIKSWGDTNKDADFFIDFHNESYGGSNSVRNVYIVSQDDTSINVFSSMLRRLSLVWKRRYHNNPPDNYVRGYVRDSPNPGTGNLYGWNLGIKRSCTLESPRNQGGVAPENYYTSYTIEVTIDVFVNYIMASLASYNSEAN